MLFAAVVIVIGASLCHTAALFIVSRRRRRSLLPAPDSLFFVFVLPCLNEAAVIGRSLQRLVQLEGAPFAVLVVDDGSDDDTAALVQAAAASDPRIMLLSRRAPDARQGKGEALNAAFRYLRDGARSGSDLLGGRRPQDVIVAVLDADGRLAANALVEVAPYFRDPRVGAVQIGVRMYNAGDALLARMQDLEFVTFTEVFQRGRQRVGSVGLGGNGQFTRLAALAELGDAPWTHCLTEDLDLGIRLLLRGWTNAFCPTTHVEQQALVDLRRLLRQRARWFQGHLQCLGHIWDIFRSPSLALRPSIDLVQHLLGPLIVLLTSLLPPLFFGSLIAYVVEHPATAGHWLSHPNPVPLALLYAMTFGLSLPFSYAYWLADGRLPLWRCLAYGHAYCLYSWIWFPAGWRGLGRMLMRRGSWAKTERIADVVPAGAVPLQALPAGGGASVRPEGAVDRVQGGPLVGEVGP